MPLTSDLRCGSHCPFQKHHDRFARKNRLDCHIPEQLSSVCQGSVMSSHSSLYGTQHIPPIRGIGVPDVPEPVSMLLSQGLCFWASVPVSVSGLRSGLLYLSSWLVQPERTIADRGRLPSELRTGLSPSRTEQCLCDRARPESAPHEVVHGTLKQKPEDNGYGSVKPKSSSSSSINASQAFSSFSLRQD